MDLKEQIKQMLGNNVPATAVAMAVGCEASYVSQLMSDEQFAQEVRILRMAKLTEATNRDDKLGKMEDALLDKIEDAIPLMFKPSELLGAYKILNSAQRRGASAIGDAEITKPVVPLTLPTVIVQQFVLNGNQQVVEVGGRPMITANSHALLDQVKERMAAKVQGVTTAVGNTLLAQIGGKENEPIEGNWDRDRREPVHPQQIC